MANYSTRTFKAQPATGRLKTVLRQTNPVSNFSLGRLRAIQYQQLRIGSLVYLQPPVPFIAFRLTFGQAIRKSSDYSLADAFGAAAYQTAEYLIISKSDVPGDSLVQLLISLISRWSNLFEDDRKIRVRILRYSQFYRQGQWYSRQSFTIALLVAVEKSSIPSPNDFLV